MATRTQRIFERRTSGEVVRYASQDRLVGKDLLRRADDSTSHAVCVYCKGGVHEAAGHDGI